MPLDIDDTLSPLDGRAAGPSQEVEGGHCFRLMASAIAAAFLYQVYLDALVIGSTDKETCKKYMAFYQMYL